MEAVTPLGAGKGSSSLQVPYMIRVLIPPKAYSLLLQQSVASIDQCGSIKMYVYDLPKLDFQKLEDDAREPNTHLWLTPPSII